MLTQQPEADDTQRSSLALGYARIFPNRHRIFTEGSLEQNQELGFDLRSSLVGGWAYALARDRKNLLTGGAGLGVNREKPVEGESTTNLELVLGLNYANFAYDFPNTDIQLTAFGLLRPQPVGPRAAGGERQPAPRAVLGFLLRPEGLRELRQRPGDGGRAEERLGPEPHAGLLVLSARAYTRANGGTDEPH